MSYFGLPQVLNSCLVHIPVFPLISVPASVPLQSFVLQMEIAFLEEDRAALIQLWHTEVPQNCQSSNSTLKARPLVRNNDKNIYPYSIHSIPQLVKCFATDLRYFGGLFLLTCFIKLPKSTFFTESISLARIPTWLPALPTWKTANPIPSADTVIAISCAEGIWKTDE